MGYETATLITDICIAVGTIGSTITAVAIAWRASLRSEAEADERTAREASQVMAIVAVHSKHEYPDVSVVNATPSVITNVRVQLPGFRAWGNRLLDFEFTSGSTSETGYRAYIKSGDVITIQARLLDRANPHNEVNPVEYVADVSALLTWQDVRGLWWARRNLDEPFATTRAYPGRHALRAAARPGWWRGRFTKEGRAVVRAFERQHLTDGELGPD